MERPSEGTPSSSSSSSQRLSRFGGSSIDVGKGPSTSADPLRGRTSTGPSHAETRTAPQPVSSGQRAQYKYKWNGHPIFPGEQPPSPPRFLPNDTPGQFFARRATYRKEYILRTESARQKAARLDREKNATHYEISQRGHDEVYEWVFDDENMCWKRERIQRNEREIIWPSYDPSCKRYDSVACEWDLAYFFDDDTQKSSVADEYERLMADEEDEEDWKAAAWDRRPVNPFFREEDYRLAPPPPNQEAAEPRVLEHDKGSLTTEEPAGQRSSIEPSDLEEGEISATPSSQVVNDAQNVSDVLDFSDVLFNRHAFRWGATPLTAAKRLSTADACKAVGYYPSEHGSHYVTDDSRKAEAFTAWISCMIADKVTPPADWWLLHKSSYPRLRELLHRSNLYIFSMRDVGSNGIQLWGLDDKRRPRNKETWFVAVDDPSTVLAAALTVESVDDAARWMVTSGM